MRNINIYHNKLFDVKTQTLSLDAVLTTIKTNNPQLKMYDADIQSGCSGQRSQKLDGTTN
jgi:hypothetical protein